ncbi:MAG: hypothetical protein ABH879_04115 [archaeon]
MPKHKTLKECYDSCEAQGFIEIKDEINTEKIRSNLLIAEEDMETAKDAVRNKRWNSVYKLYYDVLHVLVESYLVFDKVKSLNHQCLFACLCTKHLELSWDFFEKIRTKRNGINYYGQPVCHEDWRTVELQFSLYISTLRKAIENKL